MSYKNTGFRFIAQSILVFFLANTLSPTLQFAFADSTQYYVDATGGSDANDGLTPATAWQTIAQVNATSLLQGDTVSLLCGETWSETLTINTANGGPGLPITINGYGPGCTSSNPSLDGIDILSSSEIVIDGISITNPSVGSAIGVDLSNNITLSNNILSNASGICMDITNSTLVGINNNSFTTCDYGINIDTSEAMVENNTLSTIEQDAITVTSGLAVSVSQNTLSNIAQNGIIYGEATAVSQNTITNSCSTGSIDCAAIRNEATLSGVVLTSTISENIISGVGSGISGDRNYGILIDNVDGVDASYNSIINAERALMIKDANNLNIANNTLLNSRVQTVSAIQTIVGRTHTNTFSSNTILQKNPDYSHIEMRDEVPGSDLADTFLTASNNTIYPNYKPNITSYVRSVNFGGTTQEYTKDILEQFDPSVVKFQYFAYKPYTNTGSYATANLLTNPNFDSDVTGWSVAADVGLSPTLTHNVSGNYIGGSATVIPAGGSPDRIWVTNDAPLNITSGETYLITGYAKSSTGNINLRVFLHQTGNRANIYSDRIAEAYASSTGGVFSIYLTTTATAADGNLTLETSNPNIDYEIDSISIRRMNAVTKNTTANEVLVFSNSGAALYNQPCPGGVPCFAYVDGLNASTSWPLAIDPYRTSFVLWNGSPNILNTPLCSLNISAGSVPTGLPVDVDWTVTNSFSQMLNYETYTGVINIPVASSGMVTFIPPYDNITTISLDTLNDVGPRQCSIQVTTTNTAPYINPTTTTGSEDVAQINGTLSGVDLNPGDSIFFAQIGPNVTNGTLNVDLSGSFQYFPNPDFCGNDTFEFHAYDQLGHYADPEVQTISVACINDVPVANNDTGTGIAGVPLLINVIANDTDPDSPYQAQTLTITGYTNPINGTLSINANQLEYTPDIVFSGTEIFDYIISDQDGALSNTGTVTVNVTFANIAPLAQGEVYTLNEDTTLADTLTGSDANNDVLTFAATVLPTNGALNLLSDGTFTYIPDANYFGSDSFTFIVNDGVIDSSGATVNITIDPVFDAPIANDDSYSVSQDTAFFVPVSINDIDVDSPLLSIYAYTNTVNGTVVVFGTGFLFTPNTLYLGPDSFTYSLVDETGLISNTGVVNLNVIPLNNPPVANSDAYTLNEDAQYTGTLSGSDIEMDTLTYAIVTTPTNGTLISTNTGAFTYTPNANYFGTDSFTFEVSDGVNISNVATVTLNVTGVNDGPVSLGGSFTATGNSMSNSGNILLGSVSGTDIDSVGLTFSSSTLPANGALTLLSDGTFSYTPALGYVGNDNFTFTVSDGFLVSSGSTISISVINAAIPVPTVTFSASLSAVYSSGTTNLIWSSTNATSCITPWGSTATGGSYATPELTSSTTYSISCTGLGGTTLRNVTISILPPPSSPSSTVGIGGGGSPGSYAPAVYYNIVNIKDVATNSGTKIDDPVNIDDIELESAPSSESRPVFVMDDPTGLLGQLFLTNRYLIDPYAPYYAQYTDGVLAPIETNNIQTQESIPQVFDILDSVELDEYQGPTLLRYLARMFIAESNLSNDPIGNYDYGIQLMNSFDFADYSRLAFTREYIIRIFEQQQRRYEEMVYRSLSSTYDNTYNSADEEDDFGTDIDSEESYNSYEDESADLESILAQLAQDEF